MNVSEPPCVPAVDPFDHRHGRACVVRVMRELPSPPEGWRWQYGRDGRHWAMWLERVGAAPARWYVVGLPVASSASDLVSVVWAYAQGHRHK